MHPQSFTDWLILIVTFGAMARFSWWFVEYTVVYWFARKGPERTERLKRLTER